MAVRLRVDASGLKSLLHKLPTESEKRITVGVNRWAKKELVRSILISARSAGIKPFRKSRGLFTGGTYWKDMRRSYGELRMPISGVHQDSARPHWVSQPGVSPKNKPLLRSWMQRYWKKTSGSFYFEPKPFIDRGISMGKKRLDPYIQKAAHWAVERSLV